ncbi:hypothetical protein [Amycolatopsis pigmentata]|uniref:Uncharacterized protein n=1 Tax=Amycolatopsis pigmentata TaxID=450801 RepID=A0ABW5FV71_9PSEU
MSAEDEELAGRLRQLFSDDARLDLPSRPDAEQAVVAGARRRRRRRVAAATAGGALAAVVLVSGSLALAGLRPGTHPASIPAAGQPALAPSASSAPLPLPLTAVAPTQTPAPGTDLPAPAATPENGRPTAPGVSSSPRDTLSTGRVVGPLGYGGLQLGMPLAEAEATGMLADTGRPTSGCATYPLREGSAVVSGVVISPTQGIVRFQANGGRTPEGIGIGSTLDQLRSSYRDLMRSRSSPGYTASAGSGGAYVFAVDDSDTVVSFQLTASAPAC